MPISGDGFSRQYAVVADTRRRWSDEEKEAIVAEALRPGVNVSAVARRHGIKPNLLFRWRKMAQMDAKPPGAPAFLPVSLEAPLAKNAKPVGLADWAGVMQADAYAGYGELYDAARKPAPIIEAACWSHGRRKFFELATLKKAPIAIEAVRRIDELFAIEREINGLSASARLAERQERSAPLAGNLVSGVLRPKRYRFGAHKPRA